VNVAVLHGSPRKAGSSDTLASWFLDGLNSRGVHAVTEFFANEMSVRPCQGCEACNDPAHPGCSIHDDMDAVYEAVRRANLVVWAIPMYWGYMTAQTKILVDRMEAIASHSVFRGKTFVVILTYRHHYESTLAFFRRVFVDYFGVNLHTITFRSVDATSGQDIHVRTRPDVLESALNLGRSLAAELGSL